MEDGRKSKACDVVVVGGGAAGMMAAGRAAELGSAVILLEKNPYTGKKLGITGKGRCNVTNNCTVNNLIASVNGEPKFLWSAFSDFGPGDVMSFFENLGVPLKTERGNRVFPVSDRAADVVDALRTYMRKNGVRIMQGAATDVQSLPSGGWLVSGHDFRVSASAVILATGGLSYPGTGSTGDGYEFARRLGHTVTPLRPSLVELTSDSGYCGECAGLTLKNVGVRLMSGNKTLYEDFGELLFTHHGVSGPTVLSASAHVPAGKRCDLHIDLKPALTAEALDDRVQRDFAGQMNRVFRNALNELLPSSLRAPVVRLSGIDPDKQVNAVTKTERRALVALLKDLVVENVQPGPMAGAIITAGGVKTGELSPKTMESKRCPGLYFVGELLNVDGYTGGYNLQIAFSTGRAAGTAAHNRVSEAL